MGKGSGGCARPALMDPTVATEATGDVQDIAGSVVPDVVANPGHLRAVFCEGGLLRDSLWYASHATRRRLVERRAVTLSRPTCAPPAALSLDAARKKKWKAALVRIARTPCLISGDELSGADVVAHYEQHASFVWGGIPERTRTRLVAFHMADASSPETVARWETDATASFSALAEIDAGDDERRVIEALRARGATVEDGDIELPSYRSRHRIEGGKRLSLVVGDATVRYVAHHAASYEPRERVAHRLRYSFTPEVIQSLYSRLDASYGPTIVTPDNSFIVDQEGEIRPIGRDHVSPKQLAELERARAAGVGTLVNGFLATTRIAPPDATLTEDWKWKRARRGVWVRTGRLKDYRLQRRGVAALARIGTLEIEAIGEEGEPPFPKRVPKPTLRVEPPVSYGGADTAKRNRSAVRQALWEASRELGPSTAWILAGDQLRPDSVHSERRIVDVPVYHKAPASSRGVLTVDDADPLAAQAILEELGIAGPPRERVEYDDVYRGSRRLGRVLPHHPGLKSRPAIRREHMVVHGMTGVRSAAAALERLDRIHESGGLKSISERRRMNIGVQSMSPKGDIASGIDRGVPCKIGDIPTYGAEFIVFAAHPDVLRRRDVFFADRDFGASTTRYDEYREYAQRIGQASVYDPPDAAARKAHIKSGLGGSNEAWFRDELPWDEIDSVFVNDFADPTLLERVRERVARWKADGSLPAHVEVIPYGTSYPMPAIQARARIVNARKG